MINKICFSIREASEVSGICRQKLYDALRSGHLRGRKMGRRTIILLKDFEVFLGSLDDYGQGGE